MKEKILSLINKQLTNITHVNIFYVSTNWNHNSYLCNPIQETVNLKKDTYINSVNIETVRVFEDVMNYQLIFDDGEPNIEVTTENNYHPNKTVSVQKRFLRKNLVTEIIEDQISIKTVIKVGHIKLELSKKETQDLLDATKKAYERHLKLKEIYDDQILMDKLNLRLNQ